MRKTLLIGVLCFTAFAVALAPASLVSTAIGKIPGSALIQTSGTLWHGRGEVLVDSQELGSLSWQMRPAAILGGSLEYDVGLQGADQQLAGRAKLALDRSLALTASGTISANLVNKFLAPYDMMISGELDLSDAGIVIVNSTPVDASGVITWTGGAVRYVLSGQHWSSILPRLVGRLGAGPVATVFETDGHIPLIKVELLENGFARVGISKRLTRLVDNPWPGTHPDEAFVLEVEQQVF